MPFINYKHLHFRLLREEQFTYANPGQWKLEVQTNFNSDPKSGKASAKYIEANAPGFVNAVIQWIKRDQEFAGMQMDEFIDSLLTPEEITELNGMPVATYTRDEMPDK